ncbi:MAG: hypothetical protein HRT35_23315 [Algicola sp.]|nr:hypothetical protein [Algicola sp.]
MNTSDYRPKPLNGALSLQLLQQAHLNHSPDNQDITTMSNPTPDKAVDSAPDTLAPQVDINQVSELKIMPQDCTCGGIGGVCSCGAYATAQENFVYAVGVLKPVFANKGLQKAYNSAARTLKVNEHNHYEVFSHLDTISRQRPYLSLAVQATWILVINTIDSFVVVPRTYTELDQFIQAIEPNRDSLDEVLSTVIGILGPNAVPTLGIERPLPMVMCNQLYDFTLAKLQQRLISFGGSTITTTAIADVIKQLEFIPNHGDNDFDRAKNFLAFRYPDIYLQTQTMQSGQNPNNDEYLYFLLNIDTRYSDLISKHTVVDVIFTYQSNSTKQQIHRYCSVDVTGQYPFINTPLAQFIPNN